MENTEQDEECEDAQPKQEEVRREERQTKATRKSRKRVGNNDGVSRMWNIGDPRFAEREGGGGALLDACPVPKLVSTLC